jgi:predicted ferric reductase
MVSARRNRGIRRTLLTAAGWLILYFMLVATPVFILLIGPRPPGTGFWWDISLALGYSAMGMMGIQFALTARFRRATAPFGIDIIYYFHRYLAVAALGLIILHVVIVTVVNPAASGLINPWVSPWYINLGLAALLLFAVVVITSLWRKGMHISYEVWRWTHGPMAAIAFVAAIAHIHGSDTYIADQTVKTLWTAFTAVWLLLIAYVRIYKPWRLKQHPYRIVDVRRERGRVWTLTVAPEGHDELRFRAGQFAWLTIGASPFAQREHPFSFSSDPSQLPHIQFTIKELGDFTRTIGATQVGEVVYVDGPHGVFSSDRHPDAPGFVFVAGGVGIAPLMSMLRSLAVVNDMRPIVLFYGNRRWENVTFREELESLSTRLQLNVIHVLGEPPDDWQGERGVVTREILACHLPADWLNFQYFVCGPNPMLRAVEKSLDDLRIPMGKVHSEIFDLV